MFNDIAVAAHVALDAYSNRCNIDQPILVIDLDVHQACNCLLIINLGVGTFEKGKNILIVNSLRL